MRDGDSDERPELDSAVGLDELETDEALDVEDDAERVADEEEDDDDEQHDGLPRLLRLLRRGGRSPGPVRHAATTSAREARY